MPRKRGKLLKDIPKCKACGCEEVRLVTCRGVEAYLLRCGDHPFHHFSHVFRTADEAIADWRKKNSPVTAA